MVLLLSPAALSVPASFTLSRILCKAPVRPLAAFALKRYRFSPCTQNFRARFQSTVTDVATELSSGGPEIIFLGTGTSEGIPRVSCLTNPLKACEVCLKATEPGNKNRRLNTSILIRYPSTSGIRNILVDAGKFFYHTALRWFPLFRNVTENSLRIEGVKLLREGQQGSLELIQGKDQNKSKQEKEKTKGCQVRYGETIW